MNHTITVIFQKPLVVDININVVTDADSAAIRDITTDLEQRTAQLKKALDDTPNPTPAG